MMRRALLVLALIGGPAWGNPGLRIVSAEFGLFDASNPRAISFEPTHIVPHREGQRYGWIIEVRSKKRSVSVREEYLLPAAGAGAGPGFGPSGGIILLPRRTQVSQRQLVPAGGKIYGEWEIGPGEPPGKRRLQVIVEGELAGDFEYEVR